MTDNVIAFQGKKKSRMETEEKFPIWQCGMCGGEVFVLFQDGDVKCDGCSFMIVDLKVATVDPEA